MCQKEEQIHIPAESVPVIDATSVGDGLLQQRSLEDMGKMGSWLAGDVIQRYGTTLSEEALDSLRNYVK